MQRVIRVEAGVYQLPEFLDKYSQPHVLWRDESHPSGTARDDRSWIIEDSEGALVSRHRTKTDALNAIEGLKREFVHALHKGDEVEVIVRGKVKRTGSHGQWLTIEGYDKTFYTGDLAEVRVLRSSK